MRAHQARVGWAVACLVGGLFWASTALGHGSAPRVLGITFPPQAGGVPWAITDSQGLYARMGAGERPYLWLCEDAVVEQAGFLGLAPVGEGLDTWVVATSAGTFRTTTAGCSFEPVQGSEALSKPVGLWSRPDRPLEVFTATAAEAGGNDVFWTEDGGATWQGAGLNLPGPVHSVIQADGAPDVIYVAHRDGALRSEDGGRTFTPIATAPEGLEAPPEALKLMSTRPGDPMQVIALVDLIPEAHMVRSTDGGATWSTVQRLEWPTTSVVFSSDGQRALATTLISDAWMSEDGGETWVVRPDLTVPWLGCLTRAPEGDTLYACSYLFASNPGPWAMGVSEDFGVTWAEALGNFVNAGGGWDCPEDSPAHTICERFCPGQLASGMCGEAEADAGMMPSDAGPDDAGLDAGLDAGAGGADSGRGGQEGGGGSGGCQGGSGPVEWPGWLLLALTMAPGLITGRRRARDS